MATVLYISTWGSDDSTRATLPFLSALGAVEAGHQAEIALLGEATYLMKDYIVDQIDGVGWPPLKELVPQVIDHGITIHVWGGCAVARGVTEEDLEGKNAKFGTPKSLAEAVVAADRVVSYWARVALPGDCWGSVPVTINAYSVFASQRRDVSKTNGAVG